MVWERHGYRVDSSEFPFVSVQFPKAVVAAGYQKLFEHYVQLCKRGGGIGWLIDFQAFDPVLAPAAVRRAAAEVFAEHKATLLAATLCEARVAANPISRGVLTAFDWVTGPKWACKNFGDYAAAEAWVRTMLRTVGED